MGEPDQVTGGEKSDLKQRGSDVFLSYSRDDQPRAHQVLEALEAAGVSVWWDAMLEGGARFHQVTEANLENASVVVVLWSEISVASHWVHDEATRGRDRGVLVPVSLDGTLPPLGFRQFQWIDLAGWNGNAGDARLGKLVEAVKARRDGTASVAPPFLSAMTPAKTSVSRRAALVGGGAALVGLAGFGSWQAGLFGGGAGSGLKRVAVMPFDIPADTGDQTTILKSIADEIRTQLSRNRLLHVAAQTSSQALANSGKTARGICEELKVDYLLTGAVGLASNRINISCELIDGQIDRTLLPIKENVPIADILSLQSMITTLIIDELAANDETSVNLRAGGTDSVAAYNAYLEGRELFLSGASEASDRAALAKFEEAIRVDPNFAAAHTAKSRLLALMGNLYAGPKERGPIYKAAEDSARNAIRIAPDFADGYLELGYVLSTGQLNMSAAREPYEMAAKLGPGDAGIISSSGVFKSRNGQFETARSDVETAIALDPLNSAMYRFAGYVEYNAGEFQRALEWFQKALEMRENGSAHKLVGEAQLALGQLEQARESFSKEQRLVFQRTGLAIVDWLLGERSQAQKYYEQLRDEEGNKSHYQYMQIEAQWGNLDNAVSELAAAWKYQDPGLVLMRDDPLLEPIRSHPDFRAILRKIGFA
ncbi:TIR domain-containing protein [Erythrobacter sp. sf7]|uniref:TIR domain-containing protein n=1 Tax=Erythrobacter fulvus TaxID=2987523 RepID=A0ABT5JL94_9SPHN|nr:TIR domain-containing protein [Erythrobacter fulvus]MDC8753120.1 TIR domain-containing protein [Erythrobacter fulvus]